MNRLFALTMILAACALSQTARAQDKQPDVAQVAAVKAADDARVAAMRQPTKEKLEAIFSNELHYAHSSGTIDTKKSFIDVLTAGKTKYLDMSYEKRDFTFPAPNIALMTGRVRVKVESGTNKLDSVLSYMAVWRQEDGQWKFLAWQSCKLP